MKNKAKKKKKRFFFQHYVQHLPLGILFYTCMAAYIYIHRATFLLSASWSIWKKNVFWDSFGNLTRDLSCSNLEKTERPLGNTWEGCANPICLRESLINLTMLTEVTLRTHQFVPYSHPPLSSSCQTQWWTSSTILSTTSQKILSRWPHILCHPSCPLLILPSGWRQLCYYTSTADRGQKGKYVKIAKTITYENRCIN